MLTSLVVVRQPHISKKNFLIVKTITSTKTNGNTKSLRVSSQTSQLGKRVLVELLENGVVYTHGILGVVMSNSSTIELYFSDNTLQTVMLVLEEAFNSETSGRTRLLTNLFSNGNHYITDIEQVERWEQKQFNQIRSTPDVWSDFINTLDV